MTYSIVARDPDTGALGVAVQSCFFAAGAATPYLSRHAAISTQAYLNPYFGSEGLTRIADGEAPADAVADMIERDSGQSVRQVHMIDAQGRIAQFTGDACTAWAGHHKGDNVSAAGNILAGPRVVSDMVAAYLDNPDLPFAERLLAALDAGEAAGGDTRGRQAAGLVVNMGEDWRWLDLRVDDHEDPLGELRRLYEVSHEKYLPILPALPTRNDYGRRIDVEPVLAAEADRRVAQGIGSRSRAWQRPKSD